LGWPEISLHEPQDHLTWSS